MGIIRLILAVSVILSHSGPLFGFQLIPGSLAVQSFYLISGFYISLILGRKYPLNRDGIYRFYLNRFLRLAAVYWFVLLISILVAFLVGSTFYLPISSYIETISALSWWGKLYILFANFFMIGLDTMMFLKVGDNHSLQFTGLSYAGPMPIQSLFVIPQAWSLGVELWFYLSAPILVKRKTRTLVLICAASVVIRALLYKFGYDKDPWTYRFFPSELLLFVTGILLNRAYFAIREKISLLQGRTALTLTVVLVLSFPIWHLELATKSWIFLIAFAVTLPFTFAYTRNFVHDRRIGELSYPLYLCHLLVIQILNFERPRIYSKFPGETAVALSLVLAWVLYRWIDLPAERLRNGIPIPWMPTMLSAEVANPDKA